MEGDYGIGGGVNNMGWSISNIQEFLYEDVYSIPSQLPPVDFRVEETCGFNGLDSNFQSDQFGMQTSNAVDDVMIPLADQIFLNDHFYSSPPAQNVTDYTLVPDVLYCDSGSGSSGFWDHEFKIGFEEKPTEHGQNHQLVLFDNNNNNNISYDNRALVENEETIAEEKKLVGNKRAREVKNCSTMCSSKTLSRETISQYFYMPITKAARELNVGLTLLKKRCRDLGIRRWPHRKLISLQTLIKNVQELEREGSSSSGEGNNKLSEYLRVLEQEKKMLEEIPDMQLELGTKRLRQAFFKANYKKRKLLGLVDSSSSSSCSLTKDLELSANRPEMMLAGGVDDHGCDDDEYDEIKYLLDDCFSCI